MMKVAIIDDLLECRNEIRSCLKRFFTEHFEQASLHITEFDCGNDFISEFQKETYDLIFIDQYMQGLSGIDTAKQIRTQDALVTLIFITTSREHAIDSYQVRASGYLLKPFTYIEFQQVMQLAGITKMKNARFISIQNEKILLREILWCDIIGHYVQVHTEQRGILRYRIPFSTLTDTLQNYSQFVTCYKGCIINLDNVKQIDEISFLLTSGEHISFSKREKKRLEHVYHSYLFQKAREEMLL